MAARRQKDALAFTLGEGPSQLERSDREDSDAGRDSKEREPKTRAESYVTKDNVSSPEGTTLRRLLAKETLARK